MGVEIGGQWASRRSQLFMWTSCGDVTVTVQTFIVSTETSERVSTYEGWNFNSGNYLFTTDTK